MNCKDLNIPNCHQCRYGKEYLCIMTFYKTIVETINSKEEIKRIFMEYSKYQKIYLYAAVKLYSLQYKECLDKLMLLL